MTKDFLLENNDYLLAVNILTHFQKSTKNRKKAFNPNRNVSYKTLFLGFKNIPYEINCGK